MAQWLILTAPIGGGHLSAAKHIADVARSAGHIAQVDWSMIDRKMPFLPSRYDALTRGNQALWSSYYYARQLAPVRVLNARLVRRLAPISDWLPSSAGEADVILITHSLYCHFINEIRAAAPRARICVYTTDLFGGPLEWFTPGADLYVVHSNANRRVALRQGVPPGRILVRSLVPISVDEVAGNERDGEAVRMLVVGGSEGAGPIRAVVEGFLGSEPSRSLAMTVVCGHNITLRRKLADLENRDNLVVTGYVKDLSKAFKCYHLVITKPGSLSIAELASQGAAFMLMPGIAGIERPNARRLQSRGVTLLGERSAEWCRFFSVLKRDPPTVIRGIQRAAASAVAELHRPAFAPDDVLGA